MAHIGLSEAARLTGKDKATIHRAMRSGRLSFVIGPDGARQIDPAELERVFSVKAPATIAPRNRAIVASNNLQPVQTDPLLEAERSKIAILEATVADLRNRLDQREADHRQALDRLAAAQERITALLTDQRATAPAPPRRSWWRWGRRG